MNPMDLMDAIGNIPKDLIDICLDEKMPNSLASTDNTGSDVVSTSESIYKRIFLHKVRIYVSVAASCCAILILLVIYPMIHTRQPDIRDNHKSLEPVSASEIITETAVSSTDESGDSPAVSSQTSVTELTQLSSVSLQTAFQSTHTTLAPVSQTEKNAMESATEMRQTGNPSTESASSATAASYSVTKSMTTSVLESSGTLSTGTDITTTRNEEVTTEASDSTGLSHELSVKRTLVDVQPSDLTAEFQYTVTICDTLSAENITECLPDQLTDADLSQYQCVVLDTFSTDNMLWSAYITDYILHFEMTYGDSENENVSKHIRYYVWVPKQIEIHVCKIEAVYQPGIHTMYDIYDSFAIPINMGLQL